MDLLTGLSAASQALNIVKELREIDKNVDEATFKLKIADLMIALADTKEALANAKKSMSEKDTIIHELKQTISGFTIGNLCPICNTGRLKTVRVIPHPKLMLGKVGIQEKHFECQNESCSHSEKRMHDPSGLLKK